MTVTVEEIDFDIYCLSHHLFFIEMFLVLGVGCCKGGYLRELKLFPVSSGGFFTDH